jgi:hypothetical protein
VYFRNERDYHALISFRQLRKAIEDVNSGVLLGASAQSTGNVSSEQSIEEVAQSTTEKESEIGNKPASFLIIGLLNTPYCVIFFFL